ncbi:MAG: hypothetical protein JWR03_2835 [Cohnella sp.]|nr:hypothetical protein [Cohnella sp.]
MRKHRKWLMGFGIGVIIGACMLQLITFAQAQDQALTIPDGKKYTQQQLDAEVAKALAGAQKQPSTSAPGFGSPDASKPPKVEPGSSQKPGTKEPAPSAASAKGDAQGRVVSIYISKDMYLNDVAARLKKLGVIDNVNDFLNQASSISKKLKIGTSTFQDKPTYKQIMDELIRPKND